MTSRTTTPARTSAAVALAAALLAACGDGSGGAAAPVPSVPPAPSRAPSTSASVPATAPAGATASAPPSAAAAPDAPASPSVAPAPSQAVPVDKDDGSAASAQGLDTAPTGSTGPVSAAPQGGPVLFVAVRVASQNGFDRVVLEYAGDGVPGYEFSYQAEATQQATGEVVDLPGATGLRGTVRGIDWTSPENYTGPKQVRAEGTRSVTVADVGVLFEGDQDPYIGVTEEKPYRVTVLADPTRVVVDVAH